MNRTLARTLEIGDYKLVTEKNKHNAHKTTLFRKGRFCSECYGQTEYESIIKTILPMIGGSGDYILLIMLIQIGFEDGYEGEDIEIYRADFRELYNDLKINFR